MSSVPDPKIVAAELVTLRDFLRHAVSSFETADLTYGHGTTNAFDDAAFLVLEGLRLPVGQLDPWLDARLLPVERLRLAELVAARVGTRKPTAYLLGKSYIQGMPFAIDERVIVPRSYLGEMLAGEASAALFGREEGDLIDDPEGIASALELCTGSGCLAVLMAMRFPNAVIDATDLSKDALAVARRNVDAYGLAGRIRLLEGDLFAPAKGQRYDLIVANPPYVAAEVVEAFPPEFAAEPVIAHLGGADGLDLVRGILKGAKAHLNPGGGLLCEIGEDRNLLEADFPGTPFLWLDSADSEGEVFWITRENLP